MKLSKDLDKTIPYEFSKRYRANCNTNAVIAHTFLSEILTIAISFDKYDNGIKSLETLYNNASLSLSIINRIHRDLSISGLCSYTSVSVDEITFKITIHVNLGV